MPKKKINKKEEKIQLEVKQVPNPDIIEAASYTRSIQIATLHTQVLVSSDDPRDSLTLIKSMAMDLIDKYKNR